jgi:hypothetical protein
MKRKYTYLPAAFAVALGASALGCAAPASGPRLEAERVGVASSADTAGTICAAAPKGGDKCGADTQDMNTVWNQAVAAGGQPVAMWAKWPDGVTLDQLVSDPNKMKAWLADVDKVIGFVRDTKKSAESYKATMAGQLGTLLKQAKDEQAKLLAQPTVDPIGKFKKALNDKANAEKGPIQATLASDKQSIVQVQAIFDQANSDIAPIRSAYSAITDRFKAYRATETTEAGRFTTVAQQASNATLATLPDAETAILAAARDASSAPNDLVLDVMRLEAQTQQFELQYRAALAPLNDFIASHGTSVPDMTSGALHSLAGMEVYVAQRSARNDATANSLLDGAEVRRQALITLATSEATRATLAQTRLLAASTTFNDDSTARIAALWKSPPTSTKLKLPYLADRYDQFTTFLQVEPLCDASSSAWRETGCIALRRNFNTARTYQQKTIPMLITMGVSTMRSKGVDPTLLNAVQAKLTAGDVKAAAVAYDTAVHSSEGT